MVVARSKVTAQGRISVPAEIQRRLGLGPGSVLEWTDEDGRIVIRPVGRYTSEEVHRALFPEAPELRTVEELKEGVRKAMKSPYGLC